jgi:Ca-activated chloride channel family protein
VSFADPIFLLGLLLLPLAVLAYVLRLRRGRRYAVRFTAVPALKLAAAAAPNRLKHLPAALALTALVALVLASAKPQRTVAVPLEGASVILVTDHSRSMLATDVDPDRLTAAQRAARSFIDDLPEGMRVGAVAFSDVPDDVQAPTDDHDEAREVIDDQVADGGTATGEALQVALDTLARERREGRRPPAAIVLLSDGKTTLGRDPLEVAEAARRLRIPISTISLGTTDALVPNPRPGGPPLPATPDPDTLRRIAETSRGQAFTAEDEGQLSSIYDTLGARLGTKEEQREVSLPFALGGGVLLLGAAAASVRRGSRLP